MGYPYSTLLLRYHPLRVLSILFIMHSILFYSIVLCKSKNKIDLRLFLTTSTHYATKLPLPNILDISTSDLLYAILSTRSASGSARISGWGKHPHLCMLAPHMLVFSSSRSSSNIYPGDFTPPGPPGSLAPILPSSVCLSVCLLVVRLFVCSFVFSDPIYLSSLV